MITLYSRGYSISSIRKRLIEEIISLQSIYNLIKEFLEKGTIVDPHQRRRRKIPQDMTRFIKEEMSKNDELSSQKMKALLCEKWPELHVSIPTIKHTMKEMGLGLY